MNVQYIFNFLRRELDDSWIQVHDTKLKSRVRAARSADMKHEKHIFKRWFHFIFIAISLIFWANIFFPVPFESGESLIYFTAMNWPRRFLCIWMHWTLESWNVFFPSFLCEFVNAVLIVSIIIDAYEDDRMRINECVVEIAKHRIYWILSDDKIYALWLSVGRNENKYEIVSVVCIDSNRCPIDWRRWIFIAVCQFILIWQIFLFS